MTKLQPVIMWKCSDCNRIYETEQEFCICERNVYVIGSQVGSFIIIGKSMEGNRKLTVRCLLCGGIKDMVYNNLKRSKSCGCRPKYIEVVQITEDKLIYTCGKCHKTTVAVPPVAFYCCEDASDGEDMDSTPENIDDVITPGSPDVN